MAELSFTQLRNRQDKRLRDETDRTFTSTEKDEFLTTALDDAFVYDIVRDDSLTITADTSSYDISNTGITDLLEVQVDTLGNGYPSTLDRSAYDVIKGVMYLDLAHNSLPVGSSIILIGKQKLTKSDLVPEFLQEYILRLADILAYEELVASFTTRFLKNDVTMSDLSQSIRIQQARIAEIRRTLANRREVRG